MLYFEKSLTTLQKHFDKLSVTAFCQAELVEALLKCDSFLSG
jgi:hypothetical protein